MKKIGKRGISGVIVTILLILLVLSAIIIVWNAVKRFVTEESEEIDVGSFMLNLEVKKAEIVDSLKVKVAVSRGAGEGQIDKVKIRLENDDGKSQVYTSDSGLAELESEIYEILLNISNPTKVEIYPVFIRDGKEKTGNLVDSKTGFSESYENIVAWWKFEDNTADSSGNGNDGINNGAQYVDGRNGIGKALDFDGVDDFANITGFGNVMPETEITISTWVKHSGTDEGNLFSFDPMDPVPQNRVTSHFLLNSDKRIYWQFANPGISGVSMTFDSEGHNAWNHFVYIASSSNNSMGVYRNGQEIGSNPFSDSLTQGDYNWHIGGPSAGPLFKGTIDEVMVFNKALSPEEIQALYKSQQ